MKVSQLCLTLCDPLDYTVHGILQARVLERVTFRFSRGSSQPRDRTQVSHIAVGFFISWAKGKPCTRRWRSSIINLIFVLTICRVVSCCWKRVFAMISAFSWQNLVSLCPDSFCTPRPNLPVTPAISWFPTFSFQFPMLKRTSFFWC